MEHYAEEMKDINISTFNFPGVIENDFFYVDKTEYVWKLIRPGTGEYFLSRPRRFGKSLLVSTLKAVFRGRRDLFRGLAIDKMDYDWKEYPVIHLDFGACMAETSIRLTSYLFNELNNISRDYGIALRGSECAEQFANLIKDLSNAFPTGKVVILVDEYDKPILSNITNENVHEILRALKGFYGVIKKNEEYIRFAFITGVSKFSRVSLFSDLNNLKDISLAPEFAGMLGFTEAEIRSYCADEIPAAAKANGCSEEELMRLLLRWYDGYRFSQAETHVCNPVSINNFFDNHYLFSNYWYDTGTPSFLLELARKTHFDFELALSQPVSEQTFAAYDLNDLNPMGLLWQTGYLTIKEVFPNPMTGNLYLLGFPDQEVKQTFNASLLAKYSGIRDYMLSGMLYQMLLKLRDGHLEEFMRSLQSFFASIPYDLRGGDERYYQTIFFVTFLLMGCMVEAESRTSDGRIDAVIAMDSHIYLFEFKLDQPAPKALQQIEDKQYYLKYLSAGKPITMIGASFDQDKGRLAEWVSWEQITSSDN